MSMVSTNINLIRCSYAFTLFITLPLFVKTCLEVHCFCNIPLGGNMRTCFVAFLAFSLYSLPTLPLFSSSSSLSLFFLSQVALGYSGICFGFWCRTRAPQLIQRSPQKRGSTLKMQLENLPRFSIPSMCVGHFTLGLNSLSYRY